MLLGGHIGFLIHSVVLIASAIVGSAFHAAFSCIICSSNSVILAVSRCMTRSSDGSMSSIIYSESKESSSKSELF